MRKHWPRNKIRLTGSPRAFRLAAENRGHRGVSRLTLRGPSLESGLQGFRGRACCPPL